MNIFLLNLLSIGTVTLEFGMLSAELRVWNVVDKGGKKKILSFHKYLETI